MNIALKNHSQLEELTLREEEKAKIKYREQYLDTANVRAPIGHIYSVFIEEMKIKSPNLTDFIRVINEQIKYNYQKIKSPLTVINDSGIVALLRYLKEVNASDRAYNTIMNSAIGYKKLLV